MNRSPAELPPGGLVGVDPSWSRLIRCADHGGIEVTWHILDNGVVDPRLTLLCVHGNPSWSYLWRRVVADAGPDVRVIAVDQLDMGFSERTGEMRRLAARIDDLEALTTNLSLSGPIVTVAHDWGGPISIGWAQRHLDQLAGLVLLNTAVHQPAHAPAPAVIRAVRTGPLLRAATVDTAAFLNASVALCRPRLDAAVRAGFIAPYATAGRRDAIRAFVEDIPLGPDHPSHERLNEVASGMSALGRVPALLLWGPADPVFSDLYLHDLESRLPHADVHRFVGASHFVSEDADVSGAVHAWINQRPIGARRVRKERPSLCAAVDERAASDQIAVAARAGGRLTTISFENFAQRIDRLARGLVEHGIAPGDRVAVMIPPGIDLSVVLYACFRIGAVLVLVDSGLGPRNMSRALAAAHPDHLIGITKALVAARTLRWPGARIAVTALDGIARRALDVTTTMPELEQPGSAGDPFPGPTGKSEAAVVFTSGSTGPSKGVVYCHDQLQAQRDLLIELYDIGPEDRLVAAFAPFALYGPALGITSIVPDMDVTKPGTLTAVALADAVVDIDATMVFASPAALQNVVATAADLTQPQLDALAKVRLLMSAGAPVNRVLLRSAADLLGGADAHTPYGMTEVLPVSDISLAELDEIGAGDGVCVGRPRPEVRVRISALDAEGEATGELDASPGVVGEIVIAADHLKERYDRLWYTEFCSSHPRGWHRTGDAGWFDPSGYLWIGGRIGHVITTDTGPVTPVAIEHAAESVAAVWRCAAVGVGPVGTQVIAVVVELDSSFGRNGVADLDTTRAVRSAVLSATGRTICAALVARTLPVDRRHNSKLDRTRIGAWATRVLSGERAGRL